MDSHLMDSRWKALTEPQDARTPWVWVKACVLTTLSALLLLTSTALCQEPMCWANPYPGLGNVSPPVNPFAEIPATRTLYNEENHIYPNPSPGAKSSEIYLSNLPTGKRTGFFQRLDTNTLWVPVNNSQGLGMTELDIAVMFGLPLPTRNSPLLITPKFSTTFLDTKGGTDETFYTTGLALRWLRPIFQDKLMADLGVSTYYSGDFESGTKNTLRVPIHLAAIWFVNPRTKLVLGAAYTDRRDSNNVFPIGGIIWTPDEDISFELMVPRVRIAQRIRWFDTSEADEPANWVYTAFEFGNHSWSSKSAEGRVEYRDLRILVGYERRTRFGVTLGVETGYMFDRKISNFGNREPDDSVFVRLRTTF